MVHPNISGRTGVGLKMGRGFPILVSSKQKLNTMSSTESEISGVNQLMPSVICTRNFFNIRAMELQRISYTKTTGALFFWKIMVSRQAENAPKI